MKKSILAMLLAAVMVLSLTACGEAAVSSSDVVEESSAVVEESSEAVEESSEAVEESSEAAEETTSAPTTFTGDGYTIKQLGGYNQATAEGFDLFAPATLTGDSYSVFVQRSKMYAAGAFATFTKETLEPTMSALFPGFQGSIESHKFSKHGSYEAIEMTFKRTVDGVTYNEYMLWVDTPHATYQFEFYSEKGNPATVYADVISSIKVA